MKISISNYKAIRDLFEYDFRTFNIISGVNSSGKSSFIQFLILLKQTINLKSSKAPLVRRSDDGIDVGAAQDLIYKRNTGATLGFEITFEKDELSELDTDYIDFTTITLAVEFEIVDNDFVVKKFKTTYQIPDVPNPSQSLSFELEKDGKYRSKADSGVFDNDFYQYQIDQELEFLTGEIIFAHFVPLVFSTEIPDPSDTTGKKQRRVLLEPRIKGLVETLENFFNGISYLGPLREGPQSSYKADSLGLGVGYHGEFAAYYLQKNAATSIGYHKIKFIEDGTVSYESATDTFANAVNFWLCETFDLAKKIYAVENNDEYSVRVVSKFDVDASITHVGFGISQVLPIVVEGLRPSENKTFILEQPEIHLHPRVQSLLFDFLYSLTLNGKKILVETHSDHFILRMRRRIVEDTKTEEQINSLFSLVFVEEETNDHIFKHLMVSDLGTLDYFPKNFLEQPDNDYRAIVKAQANKRLKQQNPS